MGLRPLIRLGVRPLQLHTLREVCRVARIVEIDLLAVYQEFETQGQVLYMYGP